MSTLKIKLIRRKTLSHRVKGTLRAVIVHPTGCGPTIIRAGIRDIDEAKIAARESLHREYNQPDRLAVPMPEIEWIEAEE